MSSPDALVRALEPATDADAWRAVDFPGIGEAPPSWPDEDDQVGSGIGGSREVRAAMNAAKGAPLFGVAWTRAAASAPTRYETVGDDTGGLKVRLKPVAA